MFLDSSIKMCVCMDTKWAFHINCGYAQNGFKRNDRLIEMKPLDFVVDTFHSIGIQP